jgi:hypothetical protein
MHDSSARTEAEALARALELGLIDVADAVRWADQKIAQEDSLPNALYDVAMSSKVYPQDVAHLLRSIPGTFDRERAVLYILRFALDAVLSERRTPECVARAMFLLALADDLGFAGLESKAYLWDAEFDAVHEGYIDADDIAGEMISSLSKTLADREICPTVP